MMDVKCEKCGEKLDGSRIEAIFKYGEKKGKQEIIDAFRELLQITDCGHDD
jgi:hypothetical protein